MKQCYVCKEIKDLSMFNKNKNKKDGLEHRCKSCRISLHKLKNPIKVNLVKYIPNKKQCTKCRDYKLHSDFNICKRSKDGFNWVCKECDKLYRETIKKSIKISKCKSTEKRKDKVIIYQRNYRVSNQEVINLKNRNNSCSLALYIGNKDNLTIEEAPILAGDGVSLEVKCKYCGKYFIPTKAKIRRRLQSLNDSMQGTQFLYCSDECKQLCSVFNQKKWPKDLKPTTSREVDPLVRKLCFEADEWECQRCGATESLICHHILGYAQYKILGSDLTNVITFCESCHQWVHSFKGCRFIDLKCKL